MRRYWMGLSSLAAALLLAGCGSSGVTVTTPEITPAAQLDNAAIEATVQARVAATQAALAAQATTAPTQAPATQEPAVATQAPATVAPVATQAPATAAQAAATQATIAPAGTTQAPATAATQGGQAAGGDAVLALGPRSLSQLGPTGWSQPITFDVKNDCGTPALAFGGDGTAYAGCASRIYTSAGGNWAENEALLNNYNLFSDPKGRVWMFGYKTAQLIEGTKVISFDAQTAVGDDSLSIDQAAFAPDGTAYFTQDSSAKNQLVSFDGKAWKGYGKDFGFSDSYYRIKSLFATSKGELLVGNDDGVFKLENGKVAPLIDYKQFGQAAGYPDDHRFAPFVKHMAETPDGTIWIGTQEQGLFSWDGSNLKSYDRTSGLPANTITDLVVDTAGKLWVATSYGLAVLDGGQFQIAEPSTSEIADSYITRIAVRGAPKLPAPASAKKATTVSGQITESNQPLANATVGICSEKPNIDDEVRYKMGWICENQRFSAKVSTDAQGKYRVENVPTGTYSILIVDNGKGQQVIPEGLDVIALTPNREVTQDLNYDGK